ncbi:hypothetical protein [Albibacterium bauzanense]|uniref:Uncharacterized protein n=1 Tax=Albibacterium bauzanense TaxID=653929 RepID=A0A4V2PYC8_9SPHI|nr:hypothetical protein [Albibacterium bauzanense]TCK85521.1 hypothetical protein C8N28_0830 [Albibacterium bauzanense]
MDRSFIFKALLSSILLLVLFPPAWANSLEGKTVAGYYLKNNLTPLIVESEYLQQDDKQIKGKEKPGNNQKPQQPDIKTVPKARKQPRPTVVAKPKVKPKPVKVVRPKIKKP